jgi:hypothetical protein
VFTFAPAHNQIKFIRTTMLRGKSCLTICCEINDKERSVNTVLFLDDCIKRRHRIEQKVVSMCSFLLFLDSIRKWKERRSVPFFQRTHTQRIYFGRFDAVELISQYPRALPMNALSLLFIFLLVTNSSFYFQLVFCRASPSPPSHIER